PIDMPNLEPYRELELNADLLRLANVRFVFSQHSIDRPERYGFYLFRAPTDEEMAVLRKMEGLRRESLREKLKSLVFIWFGAYRPYWVYEFEKPFPRSFLVPGAKMYQSAPSLLDDLGRMSSEELRQNTLLLSGDNPPTRLLPAHRPSIPSECLIQQYAPDHIRIAGYSHAPSVLVLTDNFDRHWSARLNGRPQPIFPVDYTFRGVEVPRGPFEVQFDYVNRPLHAMYALTLLGSMLMVGFAMVRRKADLRP